MRTKGLFSRRWFICAGNKVPYGLLLLKEEEEGEAEVKRSSWLDERSLLELELAASWRKSNRSGTEEDREVSSETIPESADEKSPTSEESLECGKTA